MRRYIVEPAKLPSFPAYAKHTIPDTFSSKKVKKKKKRKRNGYMADYIRKVNFKP